jgi:hypothetical protein
MGSRYSPDTTYTTHPLCRIVERYTYYSPDLPPFPAGYFIEPHVRLECGHEVRDEGQQRRVRCWQCGPDQEAR